MGTGGGNVPIVLIRQHGKESPSENLSRPRWQIP
jgi:hypothetical protein